MNRSGFILFFLGVALGSFICFHAQVLTTANSNMAQHRSDTGADHVEAMPRRESNAAAADGAEALSRRESNAAAADGAEALSRRESNTAAADGAEATQRRESSTGADRVKATQRDRVEVVTVQNLAVPTDGDKWQACAARQAEVFSGGDFNEQTSPGAAEDVPYVVARAQRLCCRRDFEDTIVFDIGANKGRIAAKFMDSMCNIVERRYVAAGLRGELGKPEKGFSIPGFEEGRGGSMNEWVGIFSSNRTKQCPDIYAVEATPSTAAILEKAGVAFGFPKDNWHVVNHPMYHEDTEINVFNVQEGDETGGIISDGPGIKMQAKRYDTLVKELGIEGRQVVFVKIDAEGFDSNVIHGMESSLKKGLVGGFQWEVNPNWGNPPSVIIEWIFSLNWNVYLVGTTELYRVDPSLSSYQQIAGNKAWRDFLAFPKGSSFESRFIQLWSARLTCWAELGAQGKVSE